MWAEGFLSHQRGWRDGHVHGGRWAGRIGDVRGGCEGRMSLNTIIHLVFVSFPRSDRGVKLEPWVLLFSLLLLLCFLPNDHGG